MLSANKEWQMYLDVAAKYILPDDVKAFWRAVESKLPNPTALVIAYLSMPDT
jgi:hypothetical protein